MDFQVVRYLFSYVETTDTVSRKRRTVGGEESALAWACILYRVHLSLCQFRLATVVLKRCRAEIIFWRVLEILDTLDFSWEIIGASLNVTHAIYSLLGTEQE